VNLAPNDTFKGSATNRGQEFTLTQPIQPNKQYILLVNITKDDTVGGWHCRFTDGVNYPIFQASIKGVGLKKVVFTTSIALSKFFPYFGLEDCEQGRYITMENVMLLEYQQGIEDWDIPYFEGMQSVKMPVLKTTGKNLFDGELELGSYGGNGKPTNSTGMHRNKNKYIPVIGGNNISCNELIFVHQFDKNKNFIKYSQIPSSPKTIKLEDNTCFINFRTLQNSNIATIQIEYGKLVTSYEPYQSNIVTVNEDVELRGIGDVADELDLLTGELTQRIGENNEVLAQEVVKTVDLSVVDQDGNDTNLSTFDDITHVTLSSEGLIPEAELEVATKNEEDLDDSVVYTVHTLSEEFNT
jgi:hypothetical protein